MRKGIYCEKNIRNLGYFLLVSLLVLEILAKNVTFNATSKFIFIDFVYFMQTLL